MNRMQELNTCYATQEGDLHSWDTWRCSAKVLWHVGKQRAALEVEHPGSSISSCQRRRKGLKFQVRRDLEVVKTVWQLWS